MPDKNIETAIAIWGDRHIPASMIAEQVKALEACGVIDGFLIADQITNFLPRQLWTPENTPMANMMGDCDSHPDVFTMAGYLMAHAPSMDLIISTDSVRRGPAEQVQAWLTLANITEGRVTVQVGGGEVKQCKPFGHKRSQGMSRMEDLFRIYHALLEAKGKPIDFEGKRNTFTKASLGGGMPYRPKIQGLGAGPTLLDYSAKYCDGLAITCPPASPNAETFAELRKEVLARVESYGRDPESFEFCVWFPVMLTEDEAMLEAHIDNPLVKWMSGMFGRIDATLWKDEGLESPVPEDWTYYMHFLPYDTPDAFVQTVLDTTTREHVRKCWLIGTPDEVAPMIQDYIEAGATSVLPMDYLPLVLQPEAAAAAFGRSIELCGLIKAGQPAAA